jgi:hypothetical protein
MWANSLFTPDMNGSHRTLTINALVKIDHDDREAFYTFATSLIKKDMKSCEIAPLVVNLVSIQPNEREEFFAYANSLFTPDMNGSQRIMAINLVNNTPHAQRAELLASALQLFSGDMNGSQRSRVIRYLDNIPLNERAQFFMNAQQLITPDMNGFCRSIVIRCLANIPSNERPQFFINAQQLITQNMTAWEIITIIQHLALNPQNGIPFANAPFQAQAVRGLDVHAEGRDMKVKRAIELLRTSQGALLEQDAIAAKDAFIGYIRDMEKDLEIKLGTNALLMPRHEGGQDWGPLMCNQTFTVADLRLTGEELIARLWIFALSLTDPEQTNTKHGMVKALQKSYEYGQRVCNPGKTQRLICSTLQGRLQGVDVDRTSSMMVTTAQALNMFFAKREHQQINEIEALLRAANQFCDESSNVNRNEFLAAIQMYARESGLIGSIDSL